MTLATVIIGFDGIAQRLKATAKDNGICVKTEHFNDEKIHLSSITSQALALLLFTELVVRIILALQKTQMEAGSKTKKMLQSKDTLETR